MLLDANLLLYAVHKRAPQHDAAAAWLTEHLNGPRRVGLPWQSLGAFLRISTHPRAFARPLTPASAWERVTDWLAAPAAWVPTPGPNHAQLLGELIACYEVSGNLIPDAQLAALALEHGLVVCSADTDFARFAEIRWQNPVG
ncbi:MAG TPA: TA system VapC family ribonuclease toxin [Solirubrobacteraceae bacterium]|jgi:toxin-antitoxin system PIN domain toxin|nr:TA system VapC family ribonuclease toxin [Solirubrobacteraceae bacterium]